MRFGCNFGAKKFVGTFLGLVLSFVGRCFWFKKRFWDLLGFDCFKGKKGLIGHKTAQET